MDVRVGLVVASLLVAAGCSALPGGPAQSSESTPELTPAPVPARSATPTPDTVPEAVLAPGIDADGSVDMERLARAHQSYLDTRSYTWRYGQTRTSQETDRTVANVTRRVERGPNATLVEDSGFPMVTDNTRYLTDRRGYQWSRSAAESPYTILGETRGDRTYDPVGVLLEQFLDNQRFRLATVERNGRRYLRLYAPPGPPPPGLFDDRANMRDYTVTAYVMPSGFVQSLTASFADADVDHRVSIRFEYTAVGNTTVPRPRWVKRAWSTPAGTATPGTPAPNATATESR